MSNLLAAWREILLGAEHSWVLFANGTCVTLRQPEADLSRQAVALLKQYGPVVVGTDSADFNVLKPASGPGWLVTCYQPDIVTYVSPHEMALPRPNELLVGLLGRLKRHRDAQELAVVHVEVGRDGGR